MITAIDALMMTAEDLGPLMRMSPGYLKQFV
jgi:hypothetical protein